MADRLIIDLDDYDRGFIKRTCEIFHTDYYKDGASSDTIRDVIAACLSEIVALFSMNPNTLYGTINIGPDYKYLFDTYPMFIDIADEESTEDFNIAYKAFAANVYFVLSRKLTRIHDEAIEQGFSDISCSVNRFRPGLLLLNVRALSPITEHY